MAIRYYWILKMPEYDSKHICSAIAIAKGGFEKGSTDYWYSSPRATMVIFSIDLIETNPRKNVVPDSQNYEFAEINKNRFARIMRFMVAWKRSRRMYCLGRYEFNFTCLAIKFNEFYYQITYLQLQQHQLEQGKNCE